MTARIEVSDDPAAAELPQAADRRGVQP